MKRLRYTKKEAAAKLEVSDSTIDRRISDGTLEVEREYHGRTHRVWVVLEDDEVDGATDGVDAIDEVLDASPEEPASSEASTESAVLREQLRNAQELAEYRGKLLTEADAQTQMLIGLLRETQEANTISPPPWPKPSRPTPTSPAPSRPRHRSLSPGERRRGPAGVAQAPLVIRP